MSNSMNLYKDWVATSIFYAIGVKWQIRYVTRKRLQSALHKHFRLEFLPYPYSAISTVVVRFNLKELH
mgnify:CR=1 FL=1